MGFFLLRQPYWVLLAVALGILDFIPIVGAGTVMVPWAVVELVTRGVEAGRGLSGGVGGYLPLPPDD